MQWMPFRKKKKYGIKWDLVMQVERRRMWPIKLPVRRWISTKKVHILNDSIACYNGHATIVRWNAPVLPKSSKSYFWTSDIFELLWCLSFSIDITYPRLHFLREYLINESILSKIELRFHFVLMIITSNFTSASYTVGDVKQTKQVRIVVQLIRIYSPIRCRHISF